MYSEKPKLHARQKAHKPGNLRNIALDVTPRCNMRCSHCYAETFARVKPVELDALQRALDEAYELGVFHYVLQGGEAIVAPRRLEAIIRMCRPEETYINVVSNGWGMTREKIGWLKNLQVDKICFSLDSGIQEEHDASRGRGSYARVMRAIDDVLEVGLITSISTVVTHQSLSSEGFRNALDFAIGKKIRMDVQVAMPVGKWDGRKDLLLTPEDSRYIRSLTVTCARLPNGESRVKRDLYCGDCDRCPAGAEFMGITADGQVLPCNFLQFTLGNIKERSLKEMRDVLLTSRWFDGRHSQCLCGEDEEFIDTFIMPNVNRPKPLDAHEVFNLQRVHHR